MPSGGRNLTFLIMSVASVTSCVLRMFLCTVIVGVFFFWKGSSQELLWECCGNCCVVRHFCLKQLTHCSVESKETIYNLDRTLPPPCWGGNSVRSVCHLMLGCSVWRQQGKGVTGILFVVSYELHGKHKINLRHKICWPWVKTVDFYI